MDSLAAQVYVVTGGKGALGRAIVAALSEAGARAVVADLPEVNLLEPGGAERMFDLNVRSLFHVARVVLPHFLATKRGFLAAFSSEPGWSGASPGSALYGAAKAAVATFLRSLDGELAGTDARVALIYPMGAVDTPANRRDMPGFDRFIDARDIAETIVFAAQRSRAGRLLDLAVYPPR